MTEVVEDFGSSSPKCEDTHRDDFMDGCVTGYVRNAAKRITGGNCAFVDDDISILEVLAYRAVTAGLLDDLGPEMAAKFREACASHPIRLMADATTAPEAGAVGTTEGREPKNDTTREGADR